MANQLIIKAKLVGLEPLLKRLDKLAQGVRNKILRPALIAASQPMLDTARKLAAYQSGLLRKSIRRKVKTYRNTGTVLVVIGPARGFGKEISLGGGIYRTIPKFKKVALLPGMGGKHTKRLKRDPVRVAHLVEFGHGGPWGAPAYPFMRPAYHQNRVGASLRAQQRILQGIIKLATS